MSRVRLQSIDSSMAYGNRLEVRLNAGQTGVEPLRIAVTTEMPSIEPDDDVLRPSDKAWALAEFLTKGYVAQNIVTLARTLELNLAPVPDIDSADFDKQLSEFFQHPNTRKPGP